LDANADENICRNGCKNSCGPRQVRFQKTGPGGIHLQLVLSRRTNGCGVTTTSNFHGIRPAQSSDKSDKRMLFQFPRRRRLSHEVSVQQQKDRPELRLSAAATTRTRTTGPCSGGGNIGILCKKLINEKIKNGTRSDLCSFLMSNSDSSDTYRLQGLWSSYVREVLLQG
jgi:hypothetical protein